MSFHTNTCAQNYGRECDCQPKDEREKRYFELLEQYALLENQDSEEADKLCDEMDGFWNTASEDAHKRMQKFSHELNMRLVRMEAVKACIETVAARQAVAKGLGYNESYLAALEDVLIFHKATLERVKRGEGYHSTSQLMTMAKAEEVCIVCKHSKHGGVECGVSMEPDGGRCQCEG